MPLDTQESGLIVAVQVSQDAAPLLFAATEKGNLAIFDARSGKLVHLEQHLGQTPSLLLNP
jgi:methylamine dehydrogenase heavy chain